MSKFSSRNPRNNADLFVIERSDEIHPMFVFVSIITVAVIAAVVVAYTLLPWFEFALGA